MEKREPDYNPDNKMVVSNRYIYAVHPEKMSINAMKLFRLAITQCKMSDEGFYEYDFKIQDLAESFGIDADNLYKDAQENCKKMAQSLLYYGDGNPKHDWKYKTIFDECSYNSKTGVVTIQFSDKMSELFLQLKRDFTRIPVTAVLLMKSKYAIRLYELICEKLNSQFPYADVATEIQISLEEARKVTATDKKKTYDKISNFKEKVLSPAIREIEENARWKIILTDLKYGRKVTGFRMEVWSRNGWEYIEDCKRKGILPNRGNREEQLPGQMSLFDYLQ